MPELYRYLYALFAACFIGIGSGFVALTPYFLEYEAKAIRAGAELEQETGLDYASGIDCKDHPEIYADCYYAQYLLTTNSDMADLLIKLLYMLSVIGLASAVIGLYLHWHSAENKKINGLVTTDSQPQ